MKRGGYSISRGKRGYVTNTATSLDVRDLNHIYTCYKMHLLSCLLANAIVNYYGTWFRFGLRPIPDCFCLTLGLHP